MLTLLGRDSVELGSQSEGLGRVLDGCVVTWVVSDLSFDMSTLTEETVTE